MASFASLTQFAIMWTFAFMGSERLFYLNPIPLFHPVCDSFCIRPVQNWSTNTLAILASLMIHSRIVFLSGVHPYRHGDFLARPSFGITSAIVAYEPTHYVGVSIPNVAFIVVDVEKVEMKIVFFQQTCYTIMEFWMQG